MVSAPQEEEAMNVINRVVEEQRASLTVVGREVYVGTGHLPEVVADNEGVPIYQAFTIGFEAEKNTPGGKLRVKLPLLGYHQQVNAAVAMSAIRLLQETGIKIDTNAILAGLSKVDWPGRMEVLHRNPVVMADGAHNVDSIAKLGHAVGDLFPKRSVVLVVGISRDKDVPGIVRELRSWADGLAGPKIERLIVSKSSHTRAADPREVAQMAVALGLTVELRENMQEALARAETVAGICGKDDTLEPIILITGSLFVVADARSYYGLAPDLKQES